MNKPAKKDYPDREKICCCSCICFNKVERMGDICDDCDRNVHPYRPKK